MRRAFRFLLVISVLLAILAYAGSQGGPVQLAGLPLFAAGVCLAVLLQWLAFVPAAYWQTERYYDLVGGLSYVAVALFTWCFSPDQTAPRNLVLVGLITIWAVRLSSFLFLRAIQQGGDVRFDSIKTRPLRFFVSWTLQGLWVAMTSSTAMVALSKPGSGQVDSWLLLGALIWVIGFAIEVIADEQKRRFRNNPANQDRFIQSGLWAVCRHPNYLGEISLWVGIAIIAVPALQGLNYLTLLSPVFVYLLLTRISGIPLLEQRGRQRWGDNPDYQRYLANTPRLLPGLRRDK